uniref:hypothetical protein n=1 Tax=Escherichia coli TaxID=562 RepID=UPI001F46FAFD|nr:hypothetical protein [Escherichia coli]UGK56805.1 hypothetical protein [Escherichia coli]
MKNTAINISTKKPLQTVKDPVTRVSIHCTAKDEKGADVEVNILDSEQHHTTNEIKLTFGGSPSQCADNAQQSDGRAATAGGRRTATEFLLPFAVNTERSNGTTLWIEHGFIIFKGLSAGTNYVKAINLCE